MGGRADQVLLVLTQPGRCSSFLFLVCTAGPSDTPVPTTQNAVDPEFAASAPAAMLMFANGFKTDNSGRSEHMRREGDGPGFGTERIAARPDVFRLARVGAGEAPVLLNGECGS